jgi:hypothetical protein
MFVVSSCRLQPRTFLAERRPPNWNFHNRNQLPTSFNSKLYILLSLCACFRSCSLMHNITLRLADVLGMSLISPITDTRHRKPNAQQASNKRTNKVSPPRSRIHAHVCTTTEVSFHPFGIYGPPDSLTPDFPTTSFPSGVSSRTRTIPTHPEPNLFRGFLRCARIQSQRQCAFLGGIHPRLFFPRT